MPHSLYNHNNNNIKIGHFNGQVVRVMSINHIKAKKKYRLSGKSQSLMTNKENTRTMKNIRLSHQRQGK